MGKKGGKATQPHLTVDQIEKALWKCNGLLYPTSQMLNVTQQAISQRILKSERLKKVREEITEKLIDVSENVLFNHMSGNNLTAAIFHLKTKGKHRGYAEGRNIELDGTLKHSGDKDNPIRWQIDIVDTTDDNT